MGVFSKLKGIFYDEVEEEEIEDEKEELDKVSKFVKREKKEEPEMPKIEEVKYKEEPVEEEKEEPKEEVKKEENTFNERDLFRSERTFNFVDFSDDEEEEIVPSRRNVLSEANRAPKLETPVREVTENKAFKPTPVISPIWGVLDKDYKKEEIVEKESTEDKINAAVTSYDTVRRKAYGTLEDELEDTLNSMSKVTPNKIKEEVEKVDKDMDLLEQKTQKIEDLINKIEDASNELDKTMSLSIGELEDKAAENNYEEEVAKEENVSDKTLTDSTLEHDLFNLIDSMYDDKEE